MRDFDFEGNIRIYSKKNAYWLGKASQIAYESPANAKAALDAWGCNTFEYFDSRETQAFIAGNDDLLMLAFRGTEGHIRDWMTDLDIELVGGPGGRVHEGFLTALSAVWRDIWRFISQQRNRRALWVTGHSLGAALATLAVAKLRLERDEPAMGYIHSVSHEPGIGSSPRTLTQTSRSRRSDMSITTISCRGFPSGP